MRTHRRDGDSVLYREVDSLMTLLCVVINSNRNFFRATGSIEQMVYEGIEHSSFGREVARQDLIKEIKAEIQQYLD